MSFFDDFFKYFDIGEVKNELVVSIIIGVGIMISGNVKVQNFNDDEIVLGYRKDEYKVTGSNLKLKSMARGEIVIEGNVLGFVRGIK